MGIKRSHQKFIVLLICGLLIFSVQASFACTAVYVGSDVSADGSTILARTNDYPELWASHITVSPRVENTPGRFMDVSVDGKVKTELPATTYKYTATPYMNSTREASGNNKDAAVCTNEYGVAMTMSVSAFANDDALKADPLIKDGIAEDTATDLVICQSKTAREAVDVLCGIIDKYGNSECNIAIIADSKEVWYVEMYSGHQYAAVKMPKDKVSVFGNEFNLEYLSDYDDNITSKELFSLPEKKHFAVHGKNNEINLFETYSGKQMTKDYSHMRTWIGHKILAPSKYGGDYNIETMYPLCFAPDKNVSMKDVSKLVRNRFDGTQYSPDETGRIDMRVIGSETSLSAHIVQVFSDLPAEMSCVSWVSTGPELYGVFIPVSNDCINVTEAYGANQSVNDKEVFDTDHYPYYTFKEITTLCTGPENYKIYGDPVQAYWSKAESNMFSGMNKVLKEAKNINDNNARAEYITSYCNDMQTKAFEDAKEILQKVVTEQNKNSNAFQMKRNPETHEMTGEKVEIPPINISLNASKYSDIPDAPSGNGFSFNFLFS